MNLDQFKRFASDMADMAWDISDLSDAALKALNHNELVEMLIIQLESYIECNEAQADWEEKEAQAALKRLANPYR